MTVEKEYYSVPHRFVGKVVDIRIDKTTVRAFFQGAEIASHKKDASQERCHTTLDHMPEGHRFFQEGNAAKFLSWRQKKGGTVREVVRLILVSYPVEEQAYKSLFALLNLEKRSPGQG